MSVKVQNRLKTYVECSVKVLFGGRDPFGIKTESLTNLSLLAVYRTFNRIL